MSIVVKLPEPFVEMERERLASHPDFKNIADQKDREKRLRKAAEKTAINRILMAQPAAREPRPVPDAEIDRDCEAFRARNGSHGVFEARVMREQSEARIRLRRTVEEIRRQAPTPSEKSVAATYDRYQDTLPQPEQVHAAHIVKRTAEGLQEEDAWRGIAAALADLESGSAFEQAANRHSDCSGKGDLGWFGRGAMVQEGEELAVTLG